VGEVERSRCIRALQIGAYERDAPFRLEPAEIEEMIVLFEGLEERLVGTVVDEDWRLPLDKVEEMTRTLKTIEFSPTRSRQEQRSAVGEAMICVSALAQLPARHCRGLRVHRDVR